MYECINYFSYPKIDPNRQRAAQSESNLEPSHLCLLFLLVHVDLPALDVLFRAVDFVVEPVSQVRKVVDVL